MLPNIERPGRELAGSAGAAISLGGGSRDFDNPNITFNQGVRRLALRFGLPRPTAAVVAELAAIGRAA